MACSARARCASGGVDPVDSYCPPGVGLEAVVVAYAEAARIGGETLAACLGGIAVLHRCSLPPGIKATRVEVMLVAGEPRTPQNASEDSCQIRVPARTSDPGSSARGGTQRREVSRICLSDLRPRVPALLLKPVPGVLQPALGFLAQHRDGR